MKVAEKQNIRLYDLPALEQLAKENWAVPKYRAAQIYNWLWKEGVYDFREMTNVPKKLRALLQDQYFIPNFQLDLQQRSADGTIKNRYRLYDEAVIESVLIPVVEDRRFTVCVSSQVGCSLNCSFCATGKLKRVRNLSPGEIVDQIRDVNETSQRVYDHALTNIVYMGMGEPLLNFKHVLRSIDHLHQDLGFSYKRITLSTVGIAKIIHKLAELGVTFNLALSLHASSDEQRSEIMPINDQNNLKSLKEALQDFVDRARGKLTFEYIAFSGFNDSLEDARRLARYAANLPVTINIIEYNPIAGFEMKKTSKDQLDIFASELRRHRIAVTVRKSRGKDIDAACGQLANLDEKQ